MKLKSARQAWHDCYYNTSKCQMDVVIEQLAVGAQVQHSSKLNTCNAAAHQVQAGLIQSAISTLAPPLQRLGHWLYAPEGFVPGDSERIVHKTVAILLGLELNDESSDQWHLIHAAMYRYRELASQRPIELSQFKTPRKIAYWLWEEKSYVLETRRWSRDHAMFWDKALSQLDQMDKKALAPVTEVLIEANEDPYCFSEWGDRMVAMG